MASSLFFIPYRPARDDTGTGLPGAKAWFTVTGTNTPAPVYTDGLLTTPATNPVIANGVGRFPNTYLSGSYTYRVRIYAPNATPGVDTPLDEFDPYVPGGLLDYAEAVQFAATRAVMAGKDRARPVVLEEQGYEGFWFWRAGDFSANIISDPSGEFYYLATGIPATQGAWVRALRDLAQPPLAPPAGFDWYPPVAIYRSQGGVYTTNFDADLWKAPATATLYVATTGNDTTGDGTLGNPYKTIGKALTVAGALPDTGTTIYVAGGAGAAGEYPNPRNAPYFPDKNINLIATGGRVLLTNKMPIANASWSLDGAGTYTANLGGWNVGHGVRDWAFPVTWPNGAQTPQFLTLAASKAACQATPSTYWTDGTSVWVHLQDGRAPDADTGGDVGVLHNTSTNCVITHTDSLNYVEGFDFEGASFLAQAVNGAVRIGRVVVNNCTHRFTADGFPPFGFVGVSLVITNNLRAYDNGNDAFAYTAVGAGALPTYAVEIGCEAYKVGRSGNTNNGSTNHAAGRTVRVNCTYRDTLGPPCADVNSVQSWNLNVDAQDNLLGSADSQDACFDCGAPFAESCTMWLDGCKTGGAFYDFYAGPGSAIYYRNMVLPASLGGAGTIAPY